MRATARGLLYAPLMLTVILIALATHRLTYLITSDRITKRPREALQERFQSTYNRRTGTVSDTDEWQSMRAYVLGCPWCASIWAGGLVVLATVATVGVPLPVWTWLAASSVTGILSEITDD